MTAGGHLALVFQQGFRPAHFHDHLRRRWLVSASGTVNRPAWCPGLRGSLVVGGQVGLTIQVSSGGQIWASRLKASAS